MSIEIRNISKTFGDFAALKDVSFKVETGELVALLGLGTLVAQQVLGWLAKRRSDGDVRQVRIGRL